MPTTHVGRYVLTGHLPNQGGMDAAPLPDPCLTESIVRRTQERRTPNGDVGHRTDVAIDDNHADRGHDELLPILGQT